MNLIQINISDVSIDDYGTGYVTATLCRQPDEIKGCPMGRGTDADAAMADLERRIGYESHVRIGWVDA